MTRACLLFAVLAPLLFVAPVGDYFTRVAFSAGGAFVLAAVGSAVRSPRASALVDALAPAWGVALALWLVQL